MPSLPREILQWPEKDPADLLDYALDFGGIFGAGDSIATVTFTASGLTIHQQLAAGGLAVVWLSGGQSGAHYLVTCVATSSQGRTARLAAELPVRTHKAV